MPILNYNYLARALVLISLAAFSIAAAWYGQHRFALIGLVILGVFVVYMILDMEDSKRRR
jgi:hypothetical protein